MTTENGFFEHPILNSPYEYPARHWELDASGQPTQQIREIRRIAEFITPIPKPRKRKNSATQEALVFDEGAGVSTSKQQYDPTPIINDLRGQVDAWRQLPSSNDWLVTPETARLLQHWRHHKFQSIRPFFCQVEAAETAIWLTEVAPKLGKAGKGFIEHLANANAEANPELMRLALKLATGAGKTTVMAMLIAWQTINAVRRPGSTHFTRGFLVITPGLTIKDRLRVLQPNDPDSYYASRELVPTEMLDDLQRAKIVITNYHAFKRRERVEISKGGRALLEGRHGTSVDTLETEGQMIQRIMPDLMGLKNILVLNDEAHHCYKEKPGEADESDFAGDERQEAEKNNEAARLWINGIEAVQRKVGLNRVIDLSATPFFLRGSGYAEGTLFPWTMCDFSLMDAIECGIVKLPRVPVADNIPGEETPVFRNLWEHIRKNMPKKGRGKADNLDPLNLPTQLCTALDALYGHYRLTYEKWQEAGIKVPPCFIIVCNNTSTSKLVYDYISGFFRTNEDGSTQLENGRLEYFRNFDDYGNPFPQPRTLLIDSEELESGDALDPKFRDFATDEIERFRRDILERTGDRQQADNITDQDLLREVMNTVGKEGKLGGQIHCVVSVSMLTEGWDANTVNLGFDVPYRCGSESRIYRPDFIVLVEDGHGEDDLLHLVVEIKGYGTDEYGAVELADGSRRSITQSERANLDSLPLDSRPFRLDNLVSQGFRQFTSVPFQFEGKTYDTGKNMNWKTTLDGLRRLTFARRATSRQHGSTLCYVRYVNDFPAIPVTNIWTDSASGDNQTLQKLYVVQTLPKVIQRCVLMATDPGDLVLDPTCGSGTTAYVAEQWGRRWITIDTSRVALALARARIMGARYPYYFLADSPDGQAKEGALLGKIPSNAPSHGSIRQGFVYERVPHITLKSIANNAEIDVIWEEYQARLEPLRGELNAALSKNWEEWEIPRDADEKWPATAKEIHAAWWGQRITRQKLIDASIAAKADFEFLYDKPYDDKKKVRVSGPFTVESLSPHRVLAVDENEELFESGSTTDADMRNAQNFVQVILDNLKTSGVQQAHKDDKVTFSSLTPWPGDFICAEGRYIEGEGAEKRAAIFIGPEFGTVSREDLVRAAREAGDAAFDVLIACAFSYDAHSADFNKLGRIPVLKARMNADLHMAADLKNTGKGNLFVIFGEPDIEILNVQGGLIQVKVNGVDVFHPSTGEVRSNGPDEIACWFIDTDYNEESFFVRHAYFLGASDPYKSLKTTLKAEINEEAWESLHSDTSRPFDKPDSGRIAVKVINHLGDEVMKVFRVK